MTHREVLPLLAVVVALTGCGKSDRPAKAPAPAVAVEPLDGEVDIAGDGETTAFTKPAADADVQVVKLVNSTTSDVTLRASSQSGGGRTVVPPNGSRTLRWNRRAGRYTLRIAFARKGIEDVATFPVR